MAKTSQSSGASSYSNRNSKNYTADCSSPLISSYGSSYIRYNASIDDSKEMTEHDERFMAQKSNNRPFPRQSEIQVKSVEETSLSNPINVKNAKLANDSTATCPADMTAAKPLKTRNNNHDRTGKTGSTGSQKTPVSAQDHGSNSKRSSKTSNKTGSETKRESLAPPAAPNPSLSPMTSTDEEEERVLREHLARIAANRDREARTAAPDSVSSQHDDDTPAKAPFRLKKLSNEQKELYYRQPSLYDELRAAEEEEAKEVEGIEKGEKENNNDTDNE